MFTKGMHVVIAVGILIAGTIPAAISSGQTLWSDRSRPSALSFQLMKPVYAEGEQTMATSVGYLDARVDVSESVNLVVEVPMSVYDWRGPHSTAATIGNPYTGIEIEGRSGTSRLEIGARFPFAAESEYPAVWNGLISDISRFGAFLPKTYVFQAIADLRTPPAGGAYLRLRAGPQMAVPERGHIDPEIYGHYALIGGYEGALVRFGAGIAGLALLTEEDLGFDERTVHQLQINAEFGEGQLRPAVFGTFWLDEGMRQDVPFVFGVGLSWGV